MDFGDTTELRGEPPPPLELAPGHAAAAHLVGPFNERAIENFCNALRARVTAGSPNLGLVFMAPSFYEHAVWRSRSIIYPARNCTAFVFRRVTLMLTPMRTTGCANPG